MNPPTIDLTDVAAAQGIEHPPPISWLPRFAMGISSTPAAYARHQSNPRERLNWPHGELQLRADIGDPLHMLYFGVILDRQGRLPENVRKPLDILRWIVAHELAHRRQEEYHTFNLDDPGLLSLARKAYRGRIPYTDFPVEADADLWANKTWRQVRINGRRARGAR
jgi:hypothetical protein